VAVANALTDENRTFSLVAFRSAKERYFRGEAVMLLAVLALATVTPALTGANAQTAYKTLHSVL